jgi:hypothetical protein
MLCSRGFFARKCDILHGLGRMRSSPKGERETHAAAQDGKYQEVSKYVKIGINVEKVLILTKKYGILLIQ